jgi:hypothetical protein
MKELVRNSVPNFLLWSVCLCGLVFFFLDAYSVYTHYIDKSVSDKKQAVAEESIEEDYTQIFKNQAACVGIDWRLLEHLFESQKNYKGKSKVKKYGLMKVRMTTCEEVYNRICTEEELSDNNFNASVAAEYLRKILVEFDENFDHMKNHHNFKLVRIFYAFQAGILMMTHKMENDSIFDNDPLYKYSLHNFAIPFLKKYDTFSLRPLGAEDSGKCFN